MENKQINLPQEPSDKRYKRTSKMRRLISFFQKSKRNIILILVAAVLALIAGYFINTFLNSSAPGETVTYTEQ